jgi:hypothetical protein
MARSVNWEKKKFELAEETLTLAYTLQGVIEFARHPASFTGEGQNRENRDEEPEMRQRTNDAYYSRISRLSEHDDEFAKLRTIRMRFRAYFGEQAQESLSAFTTTRNEISSAVGMLISREEDERYPQDLILKFQNIIWDMSLEDKPDEIRSRINQAVKNIETVCQPILTKR